MTQHESVFLRMSSYGDTLAGHLGLLCVSGPSGWRHQQETFSALLALCVGNSQVTGVFPSQAPVTRSFDVFFDLHLNKRLSKPSTRWWFETPSRPLWRHCNVNVPVCQQSHIWWYHSTCFGIILWLFTLMSPIKGYFDLNKYSCAVWFHSQWPPFSIPTERKPVMYRWSD